MTVAQVLLGAACVLVLIPDAMRLVNAVDPDPTSIRTAIDTLAPQVKSQAQDIRTLRNKLYNTGTTADGALLMSAIQRAQSRLTNAASNETLSQLQSATKSLFSGINDALATTSTVDDMGDAATKVARQAERNALSLIDASAKKVEDIERASSSLNSIVEKADERLEAFPAKADVFDVLDADLDSLTAEVDELAAVLDEFDEVAANTLKDKYEKEAGFKGSNTLVVYRYAFWDDYGPQGGWALGNDASFFGGYNPSNWGDGNGLAVHMGTDFNTFRALFTETGYGGPMTTIFAHDKYYYSSSTLSGHISAVFRIRNKSTSSVSHTFFFYYSSYGGWNEYFSIALNDNNIWSTSGSCGSCSNSVGMTFPANGVSTVVFMTSLSPMNSNRRMLMLSLYNNCMRLPSQLEWVDDLDTATAWFQPNP